MPVNGIPEKRVRLRINGGVEVAVIQGAEDVFRVEAPEVAKMWKGEVMSHTGWGETEQDALGDLCGTLTGLGFTVMVECPMCESRGDPLFDKCAGCDGEHFVTFEKAMELEAKLDDVLEDEEDDDDDIREVD